MKLVTKHTDYALRALLYLARNPDRFIPSREIARKEGIPDAFLKRILQRLIYERLLASREGARGGVKLKVTPADLSVVDVMKIFQGPFQLTECMFRQHLCPKRSRCVIRHRIRDIETRVLDEFKDLTIETLLKEKEGSHR